MTAPLVLNVNEHVANLCMVTKMLRNAGFRVDEARTGSEAIAKAGHEMPDVIVLDVHLPDISGFEVCRRLKSNPKTKDIKVLHTSAQLVNATDKLEGVEAGADGYLAQPFEPQELIASVRSLVRLHATETDLSQRNDALVAADRRKDEWVAMLAHELRNPLAALQMGLPLLERYPAHDAVEARTREAMQRQLTQLTRLVDDLLDVSRVTRGRIELKRRPIDLAAFTVQVCEGVRGRLFQAREQQLVVDAPASQVWVSADPGRLEQIITNLLDNASKYSDGRTQIHVVVSVEDGRARLIVRDQGIGIDPAMLESVFDLFAQASVSLDRASGGLGIGLTLVKALVEQHDGRVRADSEGRGRGTTFTIELPLQDAPAATMSEANPRAEHEATRILIVDDNADGREMLRLMCELRGHAVAEAEDGHEGIERALADRPDLAIVDIGLPSIDGYEVARRLRAELGSNIHLVALSGYGTAEHRARATAAGFDEHVAKPIDVERLDHVIARARGRRRG